MEKWLLIPVATAGSGKSSLYKEIEEMWKLYLNRLKRINDKSKSFSIKRISPDEKRFEILDSKNTHVYFDEKIETKVWDFVYNDLRNEMYDKTSLIYFDATNCVSQMRYPLVSYARTYDYNILMIDFLTPLSLITSRNNQRERKVDDWVICKQFLDKKNNPIKDFEYTELFTINELTEIADLKRIAKIILKKSFCQYEKIMYDNEKSGISQ